jgi:hypothetical protein
MTQRREITLLSKGYTLNCELDEADWEDGYGMGNTKSGMGHLLWPGGVHGLGI